MPQATHISGLLENMLKNLGLDERLQQARALVIWDHVVGPQIASHTKPSKIRDGVLEVCVDQPTWMQQLQLMKPQILRKLNAELGESPLKEIFLKRGKVTARSAPNDAVIMPWKTIKLAEEEKKEVAELLNSVEDPDLRRELEKYLSKQTRLIKSRMS